MVCGLSHAQPKKKHNAFVTYLIHSNSPAPPRAAQGAQDNEHTKNRSQTNQ
jgi:hypothetical protein